MDIDPKWPGEGLFQSIRILSIGAFMRIFHLLPDPVIRSLMRRLLGRNRYPMGQLFLEKAVISFKKMLKNAPPKNRYRIVETLVINECIKGQATRKRISGELGFEIPVLIVISPTMRCPLKCYGCYSAQYSRDRDLEYDLFDRLLSEAESLGIHFFVVSGGEPFVYPGIFELFKQHRHSWFQVYTSGFTMKDGDHVSRIAELGNVIPCISVEGFEAETDLRRGPGHFQRVLQCFERLRAARIPFGFSATATRLNNDLITSDRFVDFYLRQGAVLGWYFQYMPIGREPSFDLVPTPRQRLERLNRVLELRETHDILLADFWNDGPLTGGCLAGGRRYLHINHAGDVEPCVFCQISTDNLRDRSLREILSGSPLLRAIRKRQPYTGNLLLPCMIIDNPGVLREVINEAQPRETCGSGARRLADEYFAKLEELAEGYRPLADRAWNDRYARQYEATMDEARGLSKPFQD